MVLHDCIMCWIPPFLCQSHCDQGGTEATCSLACRHGSLFRVSQEGRAGCGRGCSGAHQGPQPMGARRGGCSCCQPGVAGHAERLDGSLQVQPCARLGLGLGCLACCSVADHGLVSLWQRPVTGQQALQRQQPALITIDRSSWATVCREVHAAIAALQASSAAGVQRMRELPLDASEAAQQAALQAMREGLAPGVQQASLHRSYRCAAQCQACTASWASDWMCNAEDQAAVQL